MNVLKSISIGFTLLFGFAFSQGFKMNHSNSISDCNGALEVYDYESPSTIEFPGNGGTTDDFIKLFPEQRETNSIWLKLEPRVEGTLTLDFISTGNQSDLSYFIFIQNSGSFCEGFQTNYFKPVKYQLSPAYKISNQGAVPNYNPEIDVHMQDILYVLVHSSSKDKSSLILRYHRDGELEETQAYIQDYRSEEINKAIHIKIRDKETGEPVEANLAIDGMEQNNSLYLGTDFLFDALNVREIYIESNTQGYFLFSKTINTESMMHEDAEIIVELVKLAPGKKLKLDDIKFEIASDIFLPIARPALKRLLDFMALNEEIRIEIQGHVNSPDAKNTWATKRLSKKRAIAVYQFLKENGIAKDRMEIRGFGNTEMVYPNPKNSEEEEANRRVEILILDT